MPFEVFRRHQKKLLAVFAILAMFGFVVSDSLPQAAQPQFGYAGSVGCNTLRQDQSIAVRSMRCTRDGIMPTFLWPTSIRSMAETSSAV